MRVAYVRADAETQAEPDRAKRSSRWTPRVVRRPAALLVRTRWWTRDFSSAEPAKAAADPTSSPTQGPANPTRERRSSTRRLPVLLDARIAALSPVS